MIKLGQKKSKLEEARPRIISIMLLLIVWFSISILSNIYGMGWAEAGKLNWWTFLIILIFFFGDIVLLFAYTYLLFSITD